MLTDVYVMPETPLADQINRTRTMLISPIYVKGVEANYDCPVVL